MTVAAAAEKQVGHGKLKFLNNIKKLLAISKTNQDQSGKIFFEFYKCGRKLMKLMPGILLIFRAKQRLDLDSTIITTGDSVIMARLCKYS
jgi:hypothetical protein